MNDRIRLHTAGDLMWPFSGPTRPSYRAVNRYAWESTIYVDPFVCYHHDMRLVEKCAADVERAFPIGCLPTWHVLSSETEERTNGWCSCERIHDEGKQKEAGGPFEPVIVLIGKRIPIHPAMTRYLVTHEYGHAVQYWCMHKLGMYDDRGDDSFLRKYAEIRGCDFNRSYGGGRWHTNIGEVFANDFRIIVARSEPEFWPHQVPHPLECPRVLSYWTDVLAPLAHKAAEVQLNHI